MPYGQDAVLGLCLQNSYGTASVSSLHFMEILNEGLSLNKEQQIREGMRGIFDENPNQEGKNTVESDIVIEAHAIPLGFMLSTIMSRSTSGTGRFTHRFTPNQTDFDNYAANRPFTALVDLNSGSADRYSDLVASKLSLSISQGGFMQATLSVMGGAYSQQAAVAGSFPTGDVVDWSSTSLSLGGTASCAFEELTLNIDESLESIFTLCNKKTPSRIKRSGKRTVGISGTVLFDDRTEYQKFLAQSTQVFKAFFLTGSDSVLIDLPQLKYTAFPIPVDGPGQMRVSFEGKAEYHTGSASTCAITVVNTQAAY